MTAKPWLRTLSILELDNRRVLNGLLADPEHAGCDLRDHIVFVRDELVRIAAFARASVRSKLLCGPCPGEYGAEAHRPTRHGSAISEGVRRRVPLLIDGCARSCRSMHRSVMLARER